MSNNKCPNNNTIIAQMVFDLENPGSLGTLPEDVYNYSKRKSGGAKLHMESNTMEFPDLKVEDGGSSPFYRSDLIFPYVELHVHSPSIVELPNGDFLACWFQGSGERTADDVLIMGARKQAGHEGWSGPFLMADTPGFPDINPVLFIDPRGVLWLIWSAIIANMWETALLKYRTSQDYMNSEGPPVWAWQDVILLKPGEGFPRAVEQKVKSLAQDIQTEQAGGGKLQGWLQHILEKSKDKYFRRMGWMTRNQPIIVGERRMILPLYSDGFSFSLMAITEDWGETWVTSEPLVAPGNIQPSLARKSDGTLVAYMRDNGPPPKRLHVSESKDQGMTWSPVVDSEIPNPGSSAVVITLRNGNWLMVYNDTESGRHSLAASISPDEGRTWPWTRHLELDTKEHGATLSHYPTVIQAGDGTLHAVYSLHHVDQEVPRKTIKHVQFNEVWVRQGD